MSRHASNSSQPLKGAAGSGDGTGTSSNLFSSNQVVFCVNPVLFENCGLLLEPPSGLTTASIMRLRQESSNFTSISLASWKELAVGVLGLREAIAYSVFDVFFAMSGGCMQGSPSYYGNYSGSEQKPVAEFRQESNRALLQRMSGSVDESRWPTASTARQVSLPGLIIFLLSQLLLERPPRSPLGEISQDSIMNNVRQYLHDYITAVSVTRHGRVTIADAMELRFLLREFVNGAEQPFGTSLGFLWPRNEKTIDIAILSQFIRPRIVLPQDLLSAATGMTTPPPTSNGAMTDPLPALGNNVVVKDLRDTVFIPTPPVLSDTASRLMSSNYTVTDCSQTSFYIASALPHTRLSKLSNCTVALGPVGGVLCIDRCTNCKISALCGAIVVSNCQDMQLFVCTNTPPVLVPSEGSSVMHNVQFAPYNSHYSTLEEHLTASGISPKLNLWNVGLPSQLFVLPPEDFTPVCFPVAPQSSAVITTRTNPCTLPQPYQDALTRRLQRFQDISRDLQEAYTRLEEEGRRDLADSLRSKVHSMFVEWLHQSGQGSGLLDLLHQSPGSAAR